ncbi:MAG: hypothetical protein EOO27_04110 [Comamonadaceae bacterium]|nr:MAG: hypothetical protein EOO27_04110 [Comamonadaceae bacterium]
MVATAIEQWRKDLIDVGKRNTLLDYRDLKAGTLDLGDARPEPLTALLTGRTVPTSASQLPGCVLALDKTGPVGGNEDNRPRQPQAQTECRGSANEIRADWRE